MSTEWIAFFATVFGAVLAFVGKYFTARFSSSTENTIDLRKSTLQRMAKLEKRQDRVEERLQLWIGRYWSLYRWIVAFCIKNDLDIIPPTFHDMEDGEIKDVLNRMDQIRNDKK